MTSNTTTSIALQALTIDGASVRQDKDGMVSLTDLYQLAEASATERVWL